ncbi:MAG: hypothetical protein ACI4D4_07415 [Lachnospira sp.]
MYQCPNCGGALKFDIQSQSIKCVQCSSSFDPYSFDKTTDAEVSDEYQVTKFTCPQCGGEIVSTDNTAANFCSFCGASTILMQNLSNEKKPKYIIPFTRTKEDCKAEYKKTMKHAIFAPKELRDPSYIDGFRGIYIPYWAYYVKQQGHISFSAKKSERHGDYIYTDNYRVEGDLNCHYKGLTHDASSSFDDNISERIAPYDVKNMKAFNPSFLSGFYADTADVPSDIYINESVDFANQESAGYVNRSASSGKMDVSGTNTAVSRLSHVDSIDSSLFPVWFLSYRRKNRVAYATVNGQTGKVAADIPIDVGKFTIFSLILALPIYLLLNLFFTFKPTNALLLVSFIALVGLIVHYFELRSIVKRDQNSDDKGLNYQKTGTSYVNNNSFISINKQGKSNNNGKSKSSSLVGIVIGCVIGCILLPFLSIFIENRTNGIISAIIAAISLLMGIFCGNELKKIDLGKPKFPGYLGAVAANIITLLITVIAPADDEFYYVALVVSIVFMFMTLIDLIKYFNVLATRKLPQFTNYRGGDDRA